MTRKLLGAVALLLVSSCASDGRATGPSVMISQLPGAVKKPAGEGPALTTHSRSKALRLWHQRGNTSLSRYVGEFQDGEPVRVELWFRADSGVVGEVVLADADDAHHFNDLRAALSGNGAWQSLTVAHTMVGTGQMSVHLYGNRSGSDPRNVTSVIYDDIVVTARGGVLWSDGFENGLVAAQSSRDPNGWLSTSQPADLMTASTGATYNGANAITAACAAGNPCFSRYLGSFAAGDTVSATLWFKAGLGAEGQISLAGARGETRLVDAEGKYLYDNAIAEAFHGNGGWQSLRVSHVVTSQSANMWLYLYGTASGGKPENTSVIYDDVVVSTQKGRVLLDGFEDGLQFATSGTDRNRWFNAGGQKAPLVNDPAKNPGVILWQLQAWFHGSQINSYVLKTKAGKLIVIDGGLEPDAPNLRDFIWRHGNRVHAWFISHPHVDHIGALTRILQVNDSLPATALRIDNVYGSILTEAEMAVGQVNAGEIQVVRKLMAALAADDKVVVGLEPGQTIVVDNVVIEILGARNPAILQNRINNSSVVMRVWDGFKSILFTGDLGVEGGDAVVNGQYASRLPSDYVQMAHHGQGGVRQSFYAAVKPTHCLWPTPDWIYTPAARSDMDTDAVKTWLSPFCEDRNLVMFQKLWQVNGETTISGPSSVKPLANCRWTVAAPADFSDSTKWTLNGGVAGKNSREFSGGGMTKSFTLAAVVSNAYGHASRASRKVTVSPTAPDCQP
jgi:hypothetical protein